MKIDTVTFSPTGTSAKIADAVAGCLRDNKNGGDDIDLTHDVNQECTFPPDSLLVVSMPVYGGKVAPIARNRMDNIKGEGTPCVAIVVYGNRAYEGALAELSEFLSGKGFKVIAAAAFVGEHSYSTMTTPIASGRPDDKDIEDACCFAREINEKLGRGCFSAADISKLVAPVSSEESLRNFRNFVVGYQKQQAVHPVKYLPEVDLGKCSGCGKCVADCPTGAIADDCHAVDAAKCIKCAACVKCCPSEARTLYTPFAEVLSENFSQRKPPVWIL